MTLMKKKKHFSPHMIKKVTYKTANAVLETDSGAGKHTYCTIYTHTHTRSKRKLDQVFTRFQQSLH